MEMTLRKRSVRGRLALLVVGLGVFACLVLADTSAAAVPPTGLNCVVSDGKINGRGATYQNAAETAFAQGYRDDFCGNTPKSPEDVAGNTMVAFNDAEAEKNSVTGNGAGLRAASCRTDAYFGASAPYTELQLQELDEAPGTLVKDEGKTCSSTIAGKYKPPFQPNTPEEWPDTQAGQEDTTAPIMTVPIAGSAVALPVNLTAANCGGSQENVPTTLEFTAKEVSRVFGGDAANWDDAELVKNNPALANCTGAIIRVVREDSSGTTDLFKQYLIRAENARSTAVCAPGKAWEAYFKTDTEWPGKQNPGKEGTCSEIITPVTSGNAALIAKLKETPDGIGYADLPNAEGQGLLLPTVVNAAGTGAKAPNAGKGANCTFSVVSLPGATAEEAVGLNPKDNWGNNNNTNAGSPENHQDVADLGTLYPICGITFDLVYTGLDNGSVPNAISRLSADQRRTLYSYITYILSSAAQDRLSSNYYAPLPTAWLPTLRKGFQKEF